MRIIIHPELGSILFSDKPIFFFERKTYNQLGKQWSMVAGTKTQKAKGIPDNAEIFTQARCWKINNGSTSLQQHGICNSLSIVISLNIFWVEHFMSSSFHFFKCHVNDHWSYRTVVLLVFFGPFLWYLHWVPVTRTPWRVEPRSRSWPSFPGKSPNEMGISLDKSEVSMDKSSAFRGDFQLAMFDWQVLIEKNRYVRYVIFAY